MCSLSVDQYFADEGFGELWFLQFLFVTLGWYLGFAMNRSHPEVHQMKQKIVHKMMICQDFQEGLFSHFKAKYFVFDTISGSV